MTAAILSLAPRISYRFLFVALFVAAYPLWHANFPTVTIEHVDTVQLPSIAAPAVESAPLPATRLGQCRG
jgi:hypothetical protein